MILKSISDLGRNSLYLLLIAFTFFFIELRGEELVFVAQAAEKEKTRKKEWRKFINHLSKGIGLPIRIIFHPNYNGVIRAVEKGEANLAFVSHVPYNRLKQTMKAIKAIAISKEVNERSFYHAVFITMPVEKVNLHDLKGKTIAFVTNSVSSSLLPSIVLEEDGLLKDIKVKEFNSKVRAYRAVKKGDVFGLFASDEGFNSGYYQKLLDSDFQKNFLLTHQRLPSAVFVANEDVIKPSTIKKLKKFVPLVKTHFEWFDGFRELLEPVQNL